MFTNIQARFFLAFVVDHHVQQRRQRASIQQWEEDEAQRHAACEVRDIFDVLVEEDNEDMVSNDRRDIGKISTLEPCCVLQRQLATAVHKMP